MTRFDFTEAYNHVADEYAKQRNRFDNSILLQDISQRLAPGALVLDAGCGSGVPVASSLSTAGFSLHGIDVSDRQIELARRNCPQATFEARDMMEIEAINMKFDAVVCFYSIYHIPITEHASFYASVRRVLKPGGLFFALLSSKAVDKTRNDFYGGSMTWSSESATDETKLIINAGFTIDRSIKDSAGGESHTAVFAVAI